MSLTHGKFAKPGRYSATFRYVTTDTDARSWIQGPCTYCELPPMYRDRLEQVPAVELSASVSFDVR